MVRQPARKRTFCPIGSHRLRCCTLCRCAVLCCAVCAVVCCTVPCCAMPLCAVLCAVCCVLCGACAVSCCAVRVGALRRLLRRTACSRCTTSPFQMWMRCLARYDRTPSRSRASAPLTRPEPMRPFMSPRAPPPHTHPLPRPSSHGSICPRLVCHVPLCRPPAPRANARVSLLCTPLCVCLAASLAVSLVPPSTSRFASGADTHRPMMPPVTCQLCRRRSCASTRSRRCCIRSCARSQVRRRCLIPTHPATCLSVFICVRVCVGVSAVCCSCLLPVSVASACLACLPALVLL